MSYNDAWYYAYDESAMRYRYKRGAPDSAERLPDKFDAGVRLAQPHRITAATPDPDPELTLYREVTGRRAAGTTHAAWHAEFLATGLDLPMERMLALVTEQQHDDLLDGPAVQPASRAYHGHDRTGARWQQLRQNAPSWVGWWWLTPAGMFTVITIMLAVVLGLIAIFTA